MNSSVDSAAKTSASKTPATTATGPIVVDLGKKSRRQVRQARGGTGKLIDRVNLMLDDLRADGTIKADAQPVLIIVRQKPRKAALGWPLR